MTQDNKTGLDELERIAREEGVEDDELAEKAFAGRADVDELEQPAPTSTRRTAPPATRPTPSMGAQAPEPVDTQGRTLAERQELEAAARASGKDPNAKVNTRGQTEAEAEAATTAAREAAAEQGRDLGADVDTRGRTALERARDGN